MPQLPMIETRGLAKSFGSAHAVAGLDLEIAAGTTFCLLGPNGAGKTTVVRMLSTLLRPDSGWAAVGGHDVCADGAAVRGIIGLSGQYASVDEFLSGRANLVMIGQLCRLRRRQAQRRAEELLAYFELEAAADRQLRTYSGGMRRRLDLAASLITRPRVLFLDEPTTGLDPRSRLVMWEVIRGLATDGTTLLLTTQYLEEADQLADLICVMDHGRITASGTPEELKASVGGTVLVLSLPPDAPVSVAASILASHAEGPVTPAGGGGTMEAPVVPRSGLITRVVTELAAAGVIVDDIALLQPSLDDVFHAITGRDGAAA